MYKVQVLFCFSTLGRLEVALLPAVPVSVFFLSCPCFSTLGVFHTSSQTVGGCGVSLEAGPGVLFCLQPAASPYSLVLSTTQYLNVLNCINHTLLHVCEHCPSTVCLLIVVQAHSLKKKLQLQIVSYHLSVLSSTTFLSVRPYIFASCILTNIFELMNGHRPPYQDMSKYEAFIFSRIM